MPRVGSALDADWGSNGSPIHTGARRMIVRACLLLDKRHDVRFRIGCSAKSRDRPGASSCVGFAMAEPFDEEAFGKRIAASLARPLCGYLVPSIAKDVSRAHAIRSAISSFLFATI